MSPGKLILLAILMLPATEIAVFLAVAAAIGFAHVLMLTLATSLAGLAVLSFFGRTLPDRIRDAFDRGDAAVRSAGSSGFLVMVGGILLVIPGFVTDVVGALLLLPPMRRWIAGLFVHGLANNKPGHPPVIDLAQDEWQRVPEARLEKKDDQPPPI